MQPMRLRVRGFQANCSLANTPPLLLALILTSIALLGMSIGALAQGPPPDTVDVLSISHPESEPLTPEDVLELTVRFQVPNINLRGGDFGVFVVAKKSGSSGWVVPPNRRAGAQLFTPRGTINLSVLVGELIALGAQDDPLLIWVQLARREPEYRPPYGDGPPGVLPLAASDSFAWTVVE